jgi:membrane associated rhomboid family serine protease
LGIKRDAIVAIGDGANVLHFLANLSGLIFVGPIVWLAVGPWRGVLTFLLGNFAGVLAAFIVNVAGHDSYLGVSAGVFALFGLLVTAGMSNPRLLPRGLAIMLAWLAAITGVGAEMVSSTSTVAHLAGFATGVLAALVLPPRVPIR